MKTISNTLKIEVETWDDPGDYPSGAGGGPLPSFDYVAGASGEITLGLDKEDWSRVWDYADVDMTTTKCLQAFFDDNVGEVDHGVSNLKVTKWCVEGFKVDQVTLSVEDCDGNEIEPPEPDYDPPDFDLEQDYED